MIRLIGMLIAVVLISSCSSKDKIPSGILKPDKMEAVLWDVIKADVFTIEFIKKDTAKNATDENLKLQQQIFAIHKISKEDFYNSYDYYKTNTTAFKKVIDSMIVHAERNRNDTTTRKITSPLTPLTAK